MVYAQVPVENLVCRIYRDDEIRVQLHYDERSRLARIVTEMSPSRHLPLPWSGHSVHWAR